MVGIEGGGGKLPKDGGGGGGGKFPKEGGGGRGKFPKDGGGGGNPIDGGGGGEFPDELDPPPPIFAIFCSSIFLALAKPAESPLISYLGGKGAVCSSSPPPCFCLKNA